MKYLRIYYDHLGISKSVKKRETIQKFIWGKEISIGENKPDSFPE